MGGLALPQILQGQAQAGGRPSHKSVIMIFLAGGPPHQDMWDLKMDAPSEIRGEFKPSGRMSRESKSASSSRGMAGSWTSWPSSGRWSAPTATTTPISA
jgi:hypothetical protein